MLKYNNIRQSFYNPRQNPIVLISLFYMFPMYYSMSLTLYFHRRIDKPINIKQPDHRPLHILYYYTIYECKHKSLLNGPVKVLDNGKKHSDHYSKPQIIYYCVPNFIMVCFAIVEMHLKTAQKSV